MARPPVLFLIILAKKNYAMTTFTRFQKILYYSLVLVAFLIGQPSYAQEPTPLLQINVSVTDPPPQRIEDLANQVLFNVDNLTQEEQNVYFEITIDGRSGDATGIHFDNRLSFTEGIVDIPVAGRMFNFETLQAEYPGYDENSFTLTASPEQRRMLEVERLLPAGRYEICILAFDSGTQMPVSNMGMNNCAPFEVFWYDPPQLAVPFDNGQGAPALANDNNNIDFHWNIDPMSGNRPLTYTLEIRRFANREAANAFNAQGRPQDIFTNGLEVVRDIDDILSQQYSTNDDGNLNIQSGDILAVRVTAEGEGVNFRNQGRSNIIIVFYGGDESEICRVPSINAEVDYPVEGDTLPFTLFPVMAFFEPSNCPNLRRCTTRLGIYNMTTGSQANHDRDLRWQDGPLDFLQDYIRNHNGDMNYWLPDENYAGYTNLLDVEIGQTPPPFVRGAHYRLSSNLTFFYRREDTGAEVEQPIQANQLYNRGFSVGMPKPVLEAPEHQAVIPETTVTLQFNTGEEPEQLLPSIKVMNIEGAQGAMLVLGVKEKLVLQLARSDDFNGEDRVFCQLKKIQCSSHNAAAGNFNPDTPTFEPMPAGNDFFAARRYDVANIISTVFRDFSITTPELEPGTYYWRVGWLRDPDTVNDPQPCQLTDDAFYWFSPTREFTIDPNATVDAEEGCGDTDLSELDEEDREGECLARCDAEQVTNTTASTRFQVDDEVQIGRFEMKITEISYSGNRAQGEGTIAIPFLSNIRIKVDFSNLGINEEGKVFAGEANAAADNRTVIPRALTDAASSALGIDDAETEALNAYVNQGSRLISALGEGTPIGMPIGFDRTIEEERHTIAIVGMVFTPQNAMLDAVFSLDFPDLHGWLALGGRGICFHPQGIDLNRAILYSPVQKEIPLADATKIVFPATQFPAPGSGSASNPADTLGTFVRWDCNGFHSLQIHGYVEFDRNTMVPDTPSGEPAAEGTVKAHFRFNVSQRGNWLAQIDFENFQIRGLEGWGFNVDEAWWDFSDLRNATAMKFPKRYAGDKENTWQGFYLKSVGVKLPTEFRTMSGEDSRVNIRIDTLLIDRTGISASLFARNVVCLSEGPECLTPNGRGSVEGWAFSIDTVFLNFLSNSFVDGGLRGRLALPIAESSPLRYRAILQRDVSNNFGFQFAVQPSGNLQIPIWSATLTLAPTSIIGLNIGTLDQRDRNGDNRVTEMDYREGVYAYLTGSLTVEMEEGDLPVSFPGINFRGLSVMSWGPKYIDCEHIGFASPQKGMGGFPVQIDSFYFINRAERANLFDLAGEGGQRIGFGFKLEVTLVDGPNGFKGETELGVLARVNVDLAQNQWEVDFAGIDLASLSVSGDVGVVNFTAALRLFNSHPTYGNGFKGYVQVNIKPGVNIQATVQFGNVGGMEYWYVDGSLILPAPGAVLFPGLSLRGFGGGAWYNMQQESPTDNAIRAANQPDLSNAGTSSTGLNYTPVRGGFGFLARMILGPPAGDAYIARVEFGAEFTTAAGIQRMFLNGNLKALMQDASNPSATAPVEADLRINYDFPNQRFQASLKVFIDFAPVIRGSGTDSESGRQNLAGFVDILAEPGRWHIWLNHPEQRSGLNILGLLDVNFYMVTGNDLPPMPPIPLQILESPALAGLDLSRLTRRMEIDSTATGEGFMLGVDINSPDQRYNFLCFYAGFGARFGFDLSFRKFTQGCQDYPVVGMNGWYAQGQMYAYLHGSLGISVDLFFVKGEFVILDLEAAAVLTGGFPNPTWLKGAAGVNYNILNGLVSGTCNFMIEIGDECTPVGDPLQGIPLITGVKPGNQERAGIGVIPSVSFGMPVDRPFQVTDIDQRRFRIMYRNYKIVKERDNSEVPVYRYVLSTKGDIVSFIPQQYLDPETRYRLEITAYAQEWINNAWQDLTLPSARKDTSVVFRTNPPPEYIPVEWVQYSYPFNSQRYYIQQPCNDLGFVQFDRSGTPPQLSGIPRREPGNFAVNPFSSNSGPNAMLIPADGGDTLYLRIWWESVSRRLMFRVPTLRTNTTYCFRVFNNRPPQTLSSSSLLTTLASASMQNYYVPLSQTMLVQNTTVNLAGQSNAATYNFSVVARAAARSEDRIVVYEYFFRTSRYRSVQEKVNAIGGLSYWINSVSQGPETLFGGADPLEGLDEFDLYGVSYRMGVGATQSVPPLFYATSAWNNNWHRNFADPRVFNLQQYFNDRRPWYAIPIFPTPNQKFYWVSLQDSRYDFAMTSGVEYLHSRPEFEDSRYNSSFINSWMRAYISHRNRNWPLVAVRDNTHEVTFSLFHQLRAAYSSAWYLVASMPPYMQQNVSHLMNSPFRSLSCGSYRYNVIFRPPSMCPGAEGFGDSIFQAGSIGLEIVCPVIQLPPISTSNYLFINFPILN